MTPEELDKARAKRAWEIRYVETNPTNDSMAQIAARLAREGWMPVDPDLLAVREIVAATYEDAGMSGVAREFRSGGFDKATALRSALAAYKAGKEAKQ